MDQAEPGSGRSKILDATLAELAFLMFFLMALMTIYQKTQHDTEMAQQKTAHEKQLEKFKTQLRALGHPPCWLAPNGKHSDHAYVVSLGPDFMHVQKTKRHRIEDQAASTMPSLTQHNSEIMAPTAFFRRSARIWTWSKQQTPECRHSVILKDDGALQAGVYRKHRLQISQHFYTSEK